MARTPEADRWMLDTNMASFIIRGASPGLKQRLRTIPLSDLRISAVTEGELLYGLARKPQATALKADEVADAAIAGKKFEIANEVDPETPAGDPPAGDPPAKDEQTSGGENDPPAAGGKAGSNK